MIQSRNSTISQFHNRTMSSGKGKRGGARRRVSWSRCFAKRDRRILGIEARKPLARAFARNAPRGFPLRGSGLVQRSATSSCGTPAGPPPSRGRRSERTRRWSSTSTIQALTGGKRPTERLERRIFPLSAGFTRVQFGRGGSASAPARRAAAHKISYDCEKCDGGVNQYEFIEISDGFPRADSLKYALEASLKKWGNFNWRLLKKGCSE